MPSPGLGFTVIKIILLGGVKEYISGCRGLDIEEGRRRKAEGRRL
jgi:hypothetical protein